MSAHPIIGAKPPAIAERPMCPNCHKALRLRWRTNWQSYQDEQGRESFQLDGAATREWLGYEAYGPFCRLRCAAKYGIQAHAKTA